MLHNFNRTLELSDRLETNFLRVLYYDFRQDYIDIYRSYEYTRLCTILEGEKTVTIDSSTPVKFKYDPDKFLLMPPESNIHMTINTPTKALVYELDGNLIKKVCENVSTDYETDYNALIKDSFMCSQGTSEMKYILGKIAALLEAKGDNKEYLLDLYAQELVCCLIQIKGARQIVNSEPDNPVNKAIKYMKESCMSPISIRTISSELEMSQANFCQYFKKITGISPKEYLTNLKMERAKTCLVHESVTDTAFDLGYESVSHFIALFREKYGLTPMQYKKYCAPTKQKEE